MFKLPWTIKRVPYNKHDDRLEKVIDILFPALELHSEPNERGELIKFHVDRAVDSNLDAVLMDLQDGHNDVACHETLNDVIKRLGRLRKLLQPHFAFDPEARYIIVENESDTRKNESIKANDYIT